MIEKALSKETSVQEMIDLICGIWVSQWGLVTLEYASASDDKISLTGFWGSVENKKGIIHSGTFNPVAGILEYNYTEIYNGATGRGQLSEKPGEFTFSFDDDIHTRNGSARLFLDKDKNQLTGVFCEFPFGNRGNWIMTRLEFPQTPARFPGISGYWESDWGPITLRQRNGSVAGVWNEGQDCEITILNGAFDSERGILTYDYFDVKRNCKGVALLVLSADGSVLSGSWTEPTESGGVTMVRSDEPTEGKTEQQ
jgi:hypothetical protein